MRYLIKFSYDGTKFHGFQRQNDVKNVQGTLERVLSDVIDNEIVIKGCGRTDAGVHANLQCAHFDTDKKITKEDINIINRLLNDEIVIKNIYSEKLEQAMQTLTKEQRRRILLYYDYQLTMEEIAKIEGCAKQSVQESIEWGIKKLKKFFEKF